MINGDSVALGERNTGSLVFAQIKPKLNGRQHVSEYTELLRDFELSFVRRSHLHVAGKAGKIAEVDRLLRRGLDPLLQDNNGETPLLAALRAGHTTCAMRMLDCAEDAENFMRHLMKDLSPIKLGESLCEQSIFTPDHWWQPHAHRPTWAIVVGNYATIRFAKRICNIRRSSLTPTERIDQVLGLLMAGAAQVGNIKVVRVFLSILSTFGDVREPSMILAAEAGHVNIVKLLLKHKVKTSGRDRCGRPALLFAARGNHVKVVETLLRGGADPSVIDYVGNTPLLAAIRERAFKSVKLIGTLPSMTSGLLHPFRCAARSGCAMILELTGDLQHPSSQDITCALQAAAMYNHAEICRILLSKWGAKASEKARVNAPDASRIGPREDLCALSAAVRESRVGTTALLLASCKANLDSQLFVLVDEKWDCIGSWDPWYSWRIARVDLVRLRYKYNVCYSAAHADVYIDVRVLPNAYFPLFGTSAELEAFVTKSHIDLSLHLYSIGEDDYFLSNVPFNAGRRLPEVWDAINDEFQNGFSWSTYPSALNVAAMDGDLESAAGLIAAGASGMSDARTGSCLHWTLRAQSATAELVKLLLENGCSRTETDVTGQTALHLAARDYYIPIEVIRLLISSKALRVTDVNKETPLFAAVRTGNLDVVTLLLDSGADASALNRDRRSPLCFAMSYSVAKALLQAGTSPQIRDRTGATALVAALIRDAAGVTRAILERDLTTAEIHSKLLPTCLAAFVGVKQVQVFLDSGADFTKLDSMKRCPLHFATSAAAVKCILTGKSKARRLINARDVEGKTPLARAAAEGLDDVCVELITSGADVALVTYCADERCARLIRYPHLYTELGMLLSEIGPDFEGASRALFENGIRTISDAAKLSKADLQSIGISHLQSRLQIYEAIQEMASGCSLMDGRRAFPVFFSYYQSEGTEVARILKLYLQQSLGQAPFLDVDNLMDLQQLLMHVHSSEAVVPLLSKNYFSRPFCLCELCEAVKLGVPLVPVRIVTARKGEAFIFSDYAELIESGPALSSSDWTTVESYGFEKRDVVAAIERISQIHTLDFNAGWDEGTQKSTIERIMQRISNPYTVFTPENRADQGHADFLPENRADQGHADFLPEDCADQGVVRSVSRKSRKSSQCCIS